MLRDLVGAGDDDRGAVSPTTSSGKWQQDLQRSMNFRNTSEMSGVRFAELRGTTSAADVCTSVLSIWCSFAAAVEVKLKRFY